MNFACGSGPKLYLFQSHGPHIWTNVVFYIEKARLYDSHVPVVAENVLVSDMSDH